ncbi:MAG: AraC family transcriptional regulator [Arenicella sp.]|jgi:AraC-like DNA-binding protein|nr:AraC family transcriptional regulator [Arenicella sp.]HAU67575.1 hypothetical protein [Gammaproteobacteria bacterium]
MLLAEAFFKFATIGLLIGISALIIRDARHIRALRFALPLVLALTAMFITTGSPELSLSGPIVVPLRLYDSLNPAFIWLLGMSLFDDDFRVGLREWVIVLAFAAVIVPIRLYYLGLGFEWAYKINYAGSIFSLGLMVHLAVRALKGRKEDLVELRRKMRIRFVIAIALILVLSISIERIYGWMGGDQDLTIWITYVLCLPVVLWSVLWLARLHPEVLGLVQRKPSTDSTDAMDLKDRVAFEKLSQVMQSEQLYKNHGLSIGELASEVGLAEHHLRKLINQTLGYRNFSSYLNSYRIEAVKELLANQDKLRTPILTLALDCGFSSLAPFNRAFKASEHITPTQFREQAQSNK